MSVLYLVLTRFTPDCFKTVPADLKGNAAGVERSGPFVSAIPDDDLAIDHQVNIIFAFL